MIAKKPETPMHIMKRLHKIRGQRNDLLKVVQELHHVCLHVEQIEVSELKQLLALALAKYAEQEAAPLPRG